MNPASILGIDATRSFPLVMGIVNVTPDSFSDGGLFEADDTASAHAARLVAEGADILDIGGESSRPGHTPVSAQIEAARVLPVIRQAVRLGVPVSIDTWKADVADQALKAGAKIVNDIWGLQRDPHMAHTVAEHGAALVVMHNRDTVDERLDILDEVRRFLERSLAIAAAHGIERTNIAVDPGIGFGKTLEQNLKLVTCAPALAELGCPVLIGLSRKSFIGQLTGRVVTERLAGTLAANLAAARSGAAILRVHDVAVTRDGLVMDRAIAA